MHEQEAKLFQEITWLHADKPPPIILTTLPLSWKIKWRRASLKTNIEMDIIKDEPRFLFYFDLYQSHRELPQLIIWD